MIDTYFVYKFLKKLTTPFEKWDAYKLGVIDEDGNILKKKRELNTREEKDAFSSFDRMVLNLKKTLEKVPGMGNRLSSYAAALYLMKEGKISENINQEILQECIQQLTEEGAPVNATGSGNVAGLPPDEPPIKKRFRDKRKKKYDGSNTNIITR